MFHLDWLNDGFRTGYLYIFGNSKLNSMRMLQVSRGYLSFMYLLEVTILIASAWTWYQYKEPLLWLVVLTGIFSALTIVFQSIHISSLYLLMLKDNTLRHNDECLEKNYQFIKGLY